MYIAPEKVEGHYSISKNNCSHRSNLAEAEDDIVDSQAANVSNNGLEVLLGVVVFCWGLKLFMI